MKLWPRAVSWHPQIPGTLKSDSNPSLLKCVEDHARSLLTYLERIKKSDGFKIFLVSTGSLILIAESPNFFRRREEELKVFITCQGLILYFLGGNEKTSPLRQAASLSLSNNPTTYT